MGFKAMQLATKPRIMLLAAMLAGSTAAAATVPYPNITAAPGDAPQQENWYQQCLRVRTEEPPDADRRFKRSTEGPSNCSATDLYYDASDAAPTQHPDWRRVRQCAFATQDFGVLMMLYANGEGVNRNPRLATKYACSLDSAVAEMAERVQRLSAHSGRRGGEHFDLCDDITSGYMQGVCAAIQERQQKKIRDAQLAQYVKDWRPDELAALQGLKDRLREFANHRAQDETDLGGTARGALQIEAQSGEYEQFLRDIGKIRSCKRPAQGPAIGTLDLRVQQAIKNLTSQHTRNGLNFGTVEPIGIQRTQQAWQQYRDAWRQLLATKCPRTDPRPWLAALTARRLAQLREFSGDADQHP
jgi:hypothetical protein